MKQRIFAVLLVLALLVTVGAVAVFASTSEQTLDQQIADARVCLHCQESFDNLTWTTWTGDSADLVDGAHLKLEAPIDGTAEGATVANAGYTISGNVVLDLNGNDITMDDGCRFATIDNGARLTVLDSSTGDTKGTISGSAYGVINISAGGNFDLFDATITVTVSKTSGGGVVRMNGGTSANSTFNMYSGTLTGHETYGATGGVVVVGNKTTFTMYSGTINGSNVDTKNGGAVAVSHKAGVFTMKSGLITGGTATNGGNVFVKGTFNMEGGTISAGTATACGGNVYIEGNQSGPVVTMTMSGGTITAGTAPAGNNIYVLSSSAAKNGNLIVSGNASITDGNVVCDNSYAQITLSGTPTIDNLDVTNGNTIAFGSGGVTGGSIGITATDATAFTATGVDAAYKTYFKGAAAGKEVYILDDGAFALRNKVCSACTEANEGTEVRPDWTAWDGSNNLTTTTAEGHYCLTQDPDRTSRLQFGNASNTDAIFCVDLDGHEISVSGLKAISVNYGTVNLMNLAANDEAIITGHAASGSGGTLEIKNGSTVNLYSNVTLAHEAETTKNLYGIVYMVDASEGAGNTFNLKGGTITGSDTTHGSAVYVGTYCTFGMESGTITGTAQTSGSAVNVIDGGIVNISGGSITDGDVLMEGTNGSITLSGAPTIENVDLTSGETITLGTPTLSGANIGITATPGEAFVDNDETELPTGVAGCFTSAVAGYKVEASGNTLILVTDAIRAACDHCGGEFTWIPWDGISDFTDENLGNHYILTADIAKANGRSARVKIGNANDTSAMYCIDLNGYDISVSGTKAMTVSYGTVNLMNLKGEGDPSIITGHAASGSSGGTIEILNDSTVNLYSDVTVNHDATTTGNINGLVWLKTGTTCDFNLHGGTIIGSETTHGSTVYVGEGCTFTMTSGSITGTAKDAGSAVNVIDGGIVSISGGSITDGDVYMAGTNGSITLSGAPTIENVDLTSDATITLGTPTLSGAEIGITANTDAVILDNGENALPEGVEDNFITNVENTAIVVSGNTLVLEFRLVRDCPYCDGADPTWKAWDGTSDFTDENLGDHYILTADIEKANGRSARVKIGNANDASAMYCIDLNGHDISVSGTKAMTVYYGTVNLMNLKGEEDPSIITGHTASGASGGTIEILNDSTVNLYSDVTVNHDATTTGNINGLVWLKTGTTCAFNLYGGTIVGSETTHGSTVYVGEGCTFTMTSGSITGTAKDAGSAVNVIDGGIVSISGGSITGGDVYMAGTTGSITLSGAPEISLLDLTDAGEAALNIDALTNEADVTVKAKAYKPFTVANENIETLKNYIKPASGLVLAVNDNNQLYFIRDEFKTECYCATCNGAEVIWTDMDTVTLESISSYTRMLSGHYYLGDDFTTTSRVVVQALDGYDVDNIVINLNGHTWTTDTAKNNAQAFWVRNTGAYLFVTDTSDGAAGKIVGDAGKSTGGGVIRVTGGGEFTLDNGSLVYDGPDVTTNGGVVFVDGSSTFTMNNGTINGVDVEGKGCVASISGVFNYNGGTVTPASGTICKNADDSLVSGQNLFYFGSSATLNLGAGHDIDTWSGLIACGNEFDYENAVGGYGLGQADNTYVWYATLGEVLDNYIVEEGTHKNFIKLIADEVIDLGSGSYFVDINGKKDPTVTTTGTIYWMDCANDDFDLPIAEMVDSVDENDQPIKVEVLVDDSYTYGYVTTNNLPESYYKAPNGNLYITVEENTNQYSFHCVGMEDSGAPTVRSSVGGVYFDAIWNADDRLVGTLKDYGMGYVEGSDPVIVGYGIALVKGSKEIKSYNEGAFTFFDCNGSNLGYYLCNTRGNAMKSVLLKNIISTSNEPAQNAANAQAYISLCPFVMIKPYDGGEEEIILGETTCYSLDYIVEQFVVQTNSEKVAENKEKWSAGLAGFYDKWCATDAYGLKTNEDGTEFFTGLEALVTAYRKTE